jgi:hypothetical protein
MRFILETRFRSTLNPNPLFTVLALKFVYSISVVGRKIFISIADYTSMMILGEIKCYLMVLSGCSLDSSTSR